MDTTGDKNRLVNRRVWLFKCVWEEGRRRIKERSRAVVINFILLRSVLQVPWFALCVLFRIMVNSETMSLDTFKVLIRHSINTDKLNKERPT